MVKELTTVRAPIVRAKTRERFWGEKHEITDIAVSRCSGGSLHHWITQHYTRGRQNNLQGFGGQRKMSNRQRKEEIREEGEDLTARPKSEGQKCRAPHPYSSTRSGGLSLAWLGRVLPSRWRSVPGRKPFRSRVLLQQLRGRLPPHGFL